MLVLDEQPVRKKQQRLLKSPLLVRRIEWERYNPDDPFPIARPDRKETKPKVSVLTVRRSTCLWGILLWVLPYAMVDTWNALPSAILMYSVGICFVRELLAEEDYWLSEQEAMEKARLEHEEKLRKQRNRIMFELEVLQGRSNVRLITREEGGVSKIYAIF